MRFESFKPKPVESPEAPGSLNPEERRTLRNTLAALGIVGVSAGLYDSVQQMPDHLPTTNKKGSAEATPEQYDKLEDAIRKLNDEVIVTTDGAYVTTRPQARPAIGEVQRDLIVESGGAAVTATEEEAERTSESLETVSSAPHFEAYTEAAAAAYTMGRDQIVLTDSWGRMLGDGPVDLYDAAGYTPEEMTWRYQGGEPVGIPGMLIDELREKVSAETGVPVSEIGVQHTYLEMKKDELQDYNSLQDAVMRNANQEVPDDKEGRTFLEVIEDEFEAPIPGPDGEMLEALLKESLPALISKESLFNVKAVSSAGAKGAMQFMPKTWEQYAPEGADPTSFVEAVRAAGKYFVASYEYLYTNSLNELDVIESEFFAGDHDAFVKDFIFFCLINGYNAGDGTMRQALEHFAREYGTQADLQAFYKTTELVGGKDVFFAFTRIESQNEEVAMYGTYAAEYALAIEARRQAGTVLPGADDTRLAQLSD